MEEKPISWDLDGQVLFCGGSAWCVDKKLRTVCLGKEEEVKKRLTDERSGISVRLSVQRGKE